MDSTATPGPAAEPLADFSQAHAGITAQLKALGELPALLAPAQRARELATRALAFFDDVIREHHAQEERELFPATLAAATRGTERSQVQALVDRLTLEHRQIETRWARLAPELKHVAKGRDSTLDGAELQHLVRDYMAHAAFEEREYLPLAHTLLARDANHMAALAMSMHMRHAVPEFLQRVGHRI